MKRILPLLLLVMTQSLGFCGFADDSTSAVQAYRDWWHHGGRYPQDWQRGEISRLSNSDEALSWEACYWFALDRYRRMGDRDDPYLRSSADQLIAKAVTGTSVAAQVLHLDRVCEANRTTGIRCLAIAAQLKLESLVLSGDVNAMLSLARLMRTAPGVGPEDLLRAKNVALRAIEKGSLRGYCELGAIEFALEDPTASLAAYRAGADRGDGGCALELARWYRGNRQVPAWLVKSRKYYDVALRQDLSSAGIELAQLLDEMPTSQYDVVRAWRLLGEHAARSKAARFEQAIAYLDGKYGRPIDQGMAHGLLEQLAKEGYAPALRELGFAWFGTWWQRDVHEARTRLKAAITLGDEQSVRLKLVLDSSQVYDEKDPPDLAK